MVPMLYRAVNLVFPTRVGVILTAAAVSDGVTGFPHTRGGDPRIDHYAVTSPLFSPHAWG